MDEERHPTIVSLEGITKRFPGVLACDRVSLDIRAGEVHVLLGENGAGKSTLIAMLSGLVRPDEGDIRIDGETVRLGSPGEAIEAGIGTVFQHTMLVPSLSVADNLLLGGAWWRVPDRESLRRAVEELSASLGIRVRLDAIAAELSLGEQQQVEILRALLRESRVLILDESTSMLTPAGVEELGALMRRLVERGLAIIFISHKLDEAAAFGDRVSILRLGRKVGEIPPARFRALGKDELIAEIVGRMFERGQAASDGATPRPSPATRDTDVVLDVRDVVVRRSATSPGLERVSLRVMAGEILGIAGIDGNGQKQLAEVLAGQRAIDGGAILLGGEAIESLSVGERRRRGLRYLTDDRLGEGTVAAFPVSTNLVLKEIGEPPLWRRGIERRGAIDAAARALIADYDVRTPSVATPIGRLSGGNVQKVLLGRELAAGARLVIFNKPTYGLDRQNILLIRERILAIAASGKGVVLVSTELEELVQLCHRIAVMSDGAVIGTVANEGEEVRQRIGRLMIGAAA